MPGEWVDVEIELEATTWTLTEGHTLRLAVAGTDWPNCWPPPEPVTLELDRSALRLSVPVVDGLAASVHEFVAAPGPQADDADGVVWRIEHDVLGRETRVVTRYGGAYEGAHGARVTDQYDGTVGVSTTDPGAAWARGRSAFTITWPTDGGDVTCADRGDARGPLRRRGVRREPRARGDARRRAVRYAELAGVDPTPAAVGDLRAATRRASAAV